VAGELLRWGAPGAPHAPRPGSGRPGPAGPRPARLASILLAVVLIAAGCSKGPEAPSSGEPPKRPVGMSEEVWKVYGGAESGVTEEKKDTRREKP